MRSVRVAAALFVPTLMLSAFVGCGDEPTEVGNETDSSTARSDSASNDRDGSEPGKDASPSDATLGDSRLDVAAPTTDAALDGTIDASDAALDASDAGTAPSFVYADVNHVLGTGQSLSVGSQGTPVLSTTQPYDNWMFVGGIKPSNANLGSFVPLVEGPTLETHNAAFANLVTNLAETIVFLGKPAPLNSHRLLVSIHGVGGTAYSGLKKGTAPFAAGIAQVQAAKTLTTNAAQSYVVRAVTNVHGESDHVAVNANYKQNLVEWQKDYDTDVRAITGQTDRVVMLHTQMSSWTKYGQATSAIPMAQLDASTESNGAIVMVGPKYNLAYVADGVHLTNQGYRHMGEYYAKVYRRVILEGKPWEPVRPKSATLVGNKIAVSFHVPVPPLVLDTTIVSNPGNYGFEYADSTGVSAPSIVSVAVTTPTTVEITLSATPTGQNRRLRYAFTGTASAKAGPTTGPRGNLRDSDATPSRDGYVLYNWAVHYDGAL